MLEAILCQTNKRLIVRWLIVIETNKQNLNCELFNCDLRQTFGCELIDWDVKKKEQPLIVNWLFVIWQKKNKLWLWFEKKQTDKQTFGCADETHCPNAEAGASPDKMLSWQTAFTCLHFISVSSAAADWFAHYLHLFLALHYLIYCTDFLYFPECPSAAARQGQRTCRTRWKRSGTATRLDLSWGNVKAVRRGEE